MPTQGEIPLGLPEEVAQSEHRDVPREANVDGIAFSESSEVIVFQPATETVIIDRDKNTGGDRLERIPSEIPGIELIVRKGKPPKVIGKGRLRSLKANADRIAIWKKYERLAKSRNRNGSSPVEDMVSVAEKFGVYGVRTQGHDTKVTDYDTKISYDAGLLRESLGDKFQSFTREGRDVQIEIPLRDGETGEEREARIDRFLRHVADFFLREGRDPEEVARLISRRKLYFLDEQRLNEKIASGEINTLLPGTRRSTTVWRPASTPLGKNLKPSRQRPHSSLKSARTIDVKPEVEIEE